MLYTDRTVAALQERRDAFQRAQQAAQERRDLFSDALDWLEDLSKAEIEAAIAGIEWPGARPTVEQDGRPAVIPFPNDWSCHQDARGWAMDTLWGVTTFAADGSQIWLGADACSIPVGVVQIGWFENRHVDGGDFVKDVTIEILSPEELAGEGSRFADRAVEWRRFRGEGEAAIRFMEAHSGDDQALAFFDGPLVLPFLRDLSPERAREYVALVERLLAVSEESGVPLVGYVEPSEARDLVNLVARGQAGGDGGGDRRDAAGAPSAGLGRAQPALRVRPQRWSALLQAGLLCLPEDHPCPATHPGGDSGLGAGGGARGLGL